MSGIEDISVAWRRGYEQGKAEGDSELAFTDACRQAGRLAQALGMRDTGPLISEVVDVAIRRIKRHDGLIAAIAELAAQEAERAEDLADNHAAEVARVLLEATDGLTIKPVTDITT